MKRGKESTPQLSISVIAITLTSENGQKSTQKGQAIPVSE